MREERVVSAREGFGEFGEAHPVAVVVMMHVEIGGRVIEVDEFGFAVVAEDLDASCQRLVSCFLLASPVELFLVAARWVGVVGVGVRDGHSASLGHVHVGEAVGFDGFVVEPRAIARLPLEAADHAEFGAAATRHVVATFLELDGGGAVEAALPAFFLCDLDEFLRRSIFGTFAARVPFVVAGAADFDLAPLAFPKLPAPVGPAAGIDMDMCRLDP